MTEHEQTGVTWHRIGLRAMIRHSLAPFMTATLEGMVL